jgi:PGF-pre-PGF domain-containing protein
MKRLLIRHDNKIFSIIAILLSINLALSIFFVVTDNAKANDGLSSSTSQLDTTSSDSSNTKSVETWLKDDQDTSTSSSEETTKSNTNEDSSSSSTSDTSSTDATHSDTSTDSSTSDSSNTFEESLSDSTSTKSNSLDNEDEILDLKNTDSNLIDNESDNYINDDKNSLINDQVVKDDLSNDTSYIKIEYEIGDVKAGNTVDININESTTTSIKSLEIKASENLDDLKFEVTKLESKPSEIDEIPTTNGVIYTYMDLKILSNGTYCHGDEFETIKFEFKVEKNWVIQNNIDVDTIKMRRYSEEWQDLPTILLDEDEIFYYFESETPGFSTFTVVGNKIIETSPAIVQEKGGIPFQFGILVIAIISLSIFLALFKSRFIYKD